MFMLFAIYVFLMTIWFMWKWHHELDAELVKGYFAQWDDIIYRMVQAKTDEEFNAAHVKSMAWGLFFDARNGMQP
jgi:hypothetical protein